MSEQKSRGSEEKSRGRRRIAFTWLGVMGVFYNMPPVAGVAFARLGCFFIHGKDTKRVFVLSVELYLVFLSVF
jgi:hypothetical protein